MIIVQEIILRECTPPDGDVNYEFIIVGEREEKRTFWMQYVSPKRYPNYAEANLAAIEYLRENPQKYHYVAQNTKLTLI